MAGLMTVKRLRKLLADKALDNSVVFMSGGDALYIGTPEHPSKLIDFFNEEMKDTLGSARIPLKSEEN